MGNALASRALLDGAHVLDAFAGSGAAGLELLSRGAAHVTFVERDRAAFALLKENVDGLLGGSDMAAAVTRLLHADVLLDNGAQLSAFVGPAGGALPAALIVVLDPPWDSLREASRESFCTALDAMLGIVAPEVDAATLPDGEVRPAVVFALVHDEKTEPPAAIGGRALVEDRAYSRSHIAWYGDF